MRTALCLAAMAGALLAQPKFEYWPGASYDPAVPTLKQAIGHDPGERITRPEDIL